jgi:hypothetical protein
MRDYRLEGVLANGATVTLSVERSHQRFVLHTLGWEVTALRFVPLATNGCAEFRVFDFEVM